MERIKKAREDEREAEMDGDDIDRNAPERNMAIGCGKMAGGTLGLHPVIDCG